MTNIALPPRERPFLSGQNKVDIVWYDFLGKLAKLSNKSIVSSDPATNGTNILLEVDGTTYEVETV